MNWHIKLPEYDYEQCLPGLFAATAVVGIVCGLAMIHPGLAVLAFGVAFAYASYLINRELQERRKG